MNPQKISTWIKQQVRAAGAKGIILGLSGGIDSALVAVLAQKALGKNVLCFILPCNGLREDIKDARLVARKFNIPTKLVDLTLAYATLMKTLPKAGHKTAGNLKARLRMMVLYYYANKLNYLVAGTGNKSELMVGYFTKYGDGGVDIMPIADLCKAEVRALSRQLGIPERIIAKAPSAGLWQGQTDEQELGLTYENLDAALRILKKGKPAKQDHTVTKVAALVRASEHKRQCPRICYL